MRDLFQKVGLFFQGCAMLILFVVAAVIFAIAAFLVITDSGGN